jgi:hypothetical protein
MYKVCVNNLFYFEVETIGSFAWRMPEVHLEREGNNVYLVVEE